MIFHLKTKGCPRQTKAPFCPQSVVNCRIRLPSSAQRKRRRCCSPDNSGIVWPSSERRWHLSRAEGLSPICHVSLWRSLPFPKGASPSSQKRSSSPPNASSPDNDDPLAFEEAVKRSPEWSTQNGDGSHSTLNCWSSFSGRASRSSQSVSYTSKKEAVNHGWKQQGHDERALMSKRVFVLSYGKRN